MKKYLAAVLIIAVFIPAMQVYAKKEIKRKPLEQRQENYIEIDNLNLSNKRLEKFNRINTMEYTALRPISLKLEANLLRMDELNEIKCRFYQRACKKELKKNKAFISDDIKELKRQVWQKKEYYKILYINEITRVQHTMLRKMIKNTTNDKIQLW